MLQALVGEKAFESKLLTPAKVEKLVGKDLLKDMVMKVEGSVSVAPMSDKRKAIDPNSAKNDFIEV